MDDKLCTSLPFEIFEPTLGPVLAAPKPMPMPPASGIDAACSVQFHSTIDLTMIASLVLFDSQDEAQEKYYGYGSTMTSMDVRELPVPVKKAQWGLGQFRVRGMALDRNMVVLVISELDGASDAVDVHFGDLMAAFLRATVNAVRNVNHLSV